jgi:hypothetical protein
VEYFLKTKFPKATADDIAHAVSVFGGRISDIEAYVSRTKAGALPAGNYDHNQGIFMKKKRKKTYHIFQ